MMERDDATELIAETASWTECVLGEAHALLVSVNRLGELLESRDYDRAARVLAEAVDDIRDTIAEAKND